MAALPPLLSSSSKKDLFRPVRSPRGDQQLPRRKLPQLPPSRLRERNMLLLNVYSAELDMSLKLAFSRHMLVAQAIQFIIKRFFIVFGDKATHSMPSLEELAQFSLVLLRDGGEPQHMHRERPLSAHNLKDEDTVEVRPRSGAGFILKVLVPTAQSSVTVRLDTADTPVWVVIQKLCKKWISMNQAIRDLDSYGLFLEGVAGEKYTLLDDRENLSTYRLPQNVKLLFRSRGDPGTPHLSLRVRLVDDYAGAGTGCSEHSLTFDPERSVAEALRKVVKLTPACDSWSFVCCVPLGDDPLECAAVRDEQRPLGALGLRPNDVLVVRRLIFELVVLVPDGSDERLVLDADATVRDALELLAFNLPTLKALGEYALYLRGEPLPEAELICSFDTREPLVFRRKLRRLNVQLREGRVAAFHVDFALPIRGNLMDSLCSQFLLPHLNDDDYQLLPADAPTKALDPSRSLSDQNIKPDSTLILRPKHRVELPDDDSLSADVRTNIWDEPETADTLELEPPPADRPQQPPEVTAGTLNQLVARLAQESDQLPYYVKAFFMTYRSFTTPRVLLNKLIERYHVPPRLEGAVNARTIQLRVCNALKTWIAEHHYDFDSELTTGVLQFLDSAVTKENAALAQALRVALMKKTYGSSSSASLVRPPLEQPAAAMSTSPKPSGARAIVLIDCLEDDIAAQLTYQEYQLYANIKPQELLGQPWAKPALQSRAPNVLGMINKFNQVGLWVAHCLIAPQSLKARVAVFVKVIVIARLLLDRNNFSTLMAFLGGINNAAVMRLKFTRAALPKKAEEILSELEQLMASRESYKNYRDFLHKANPPLVPYIGVYLKDLTFIEDGNKDTTSRGLINFAKRRMLYKVIQEVLLYQHTKYDITPIPELLIAAAELPLYDEKELFNTSLLREPRDADKSQIQP